MALDPVVTILISATVLLYLCGVVGCYLRWLQLRPRSGTVTIFGGFLQRVKFEIVYPANYKGGRFKWATFGNKNPGQDTSFSWTDKISDSKLTPGKAEDKRVHVIWQIDQPVVEAHFESERLQASESPLPPLIEPREPSSFIESSEDTDRMPMTALDSCLTDRTGLYYSSHASGHMELTVSDGAMPEYLAKQRAQKGMGDINEEEDGTTLPPPPSLSEVKSMFEQGEKVEYYSVTHRCWVLGKLQWQLSTRPDNSPHITYHVVTGNDNLRRDVPVDALRKPLESGDMVEIFVRKTGMWAAAMVDGAQPRNATTAGYQIRLVGSDDLLSMVPAVRLRLRFPAGQKVRVYKGPLQGWVSAVVDDTAPYDGVGATVVRIGKSRRSQSEGQVQYDSNMFRSAEIPLYTSHHSVNSQVLTGSQMGKQYSQRSQKSNESPRRIGSPGRQSPKRDLLPRSPHYSSQASNGSNARAMSLALGETDFSSQRWVYVPVLCEGSTMVETFPSYRVYHRKQWKI